MTFKNDETGHNNTRVLCKKLGFHFLNPILLEGRVFCEHENQMWLGILGNSFIYKAQKLGIGSEWLTITLTKVSAGEKVLLVRELLSQTRNWFKMCLVSWSCPCKNESLIEKDNQWREDHSLREGNSVYVSKDLNTCIIHTIYSAGNRTTAQRQYDKRETAHLPLTLPV